MKVCRDRRSLAVEVARSAKAISRYCMSTDTRTICRIRRLLVMGAATVPFTALHFFFFPSFLFCSLFCFIFITFFIPYPSFHH